MQPKNQGEKNQRIFFIEVFVEIYYNIKNKNFIGAC
jgi:hypothetical protein